MEESKQYFVTYYYLGGNLEELLEQLSDGKFTGQYIQRKNM